MFGQAPNSTGCFWDLLTHISGRMGNAEGAFYTQVESTNSVVTSVDNSVKVNVGDIDGIGFDLSRSSDIYTGTKLQPSAIQCLACIRI